MSEKKSQPKNNLKSMVAIYDFELFPYALGDVLTWNVQTAMRCRELGLTAVDIYICLDKRYPSGIFQRELINTENYELFFSELYGAFGTHPCLGNIFIYRRREELVERLLSIGEEELSVIEGIDDYLSILEFSARHKTRTDIITAEFKKNDGIRKAIKKAIPQFAKDIIVRILMPGHRRLNDYYKKYIYSHKAINAFAEKYSEIPLLGDSLGCGADIDELIEQKLKNRCIVAIHLRLRQLDVGYGGDGSYHRDSDFFEWYEFFQKANKQFPNVIFIALGRLQEKPLALLSLPNVISLRNYGMGLGHELTLLKRSNLFIGSSSGFAAYANFSEIPYFITKMNAGACKAYEIPHGCEKLPFAFKNQKLIYELETSELLINLLNQGLEDIVSNNTLIDDRTIKYDVQENKMIDVQAWREARLKPFNLSATTGRFWTDTHYQEGETGFLLTPVLQRIQSLIHKKRIDEAKELMQRLNYLFPDICQRLPDYLSNLEQIEI
jgi:hypothetical protein